MKPLKKHPKQQRMEEMTFPLQKPGRKIQREHRQYQGNLDVCVGDLKQDEEYEAYWDGNNWIIKDKVIWTGREYLRSINDDLGFTLLPRLAWRVVAVVILIIICLVIIL